MEPVTTFTVTLPPVVQSSNHPLVPALREGGDDGRPITAVDPDSEASQAFHAMAKQIAEDLKPKKIYSDALKVN